MSAGEIQEALQIPAPTLSHHLEQLRGARLIQSRGFVPLIVIRKVSSRWASSSFSEALRVGRLVAGPMASAWALCLLYKAMSQTEIPCRFSNGLAAAAHQRHHLGFMPPVGFVDFFVCSTKQRLPEPPAIHSGFCANMISNLCQEDCLLL